MPKACAAIAKFENLLKSLSTIIYRYVVFVCYFFDKKTEFRTENRAEP